MAVHVPTTYRPWPRWQPRRSSIGRCSAGAAVSRAIMTALPDNARPTTECTAAPPRLSRRVSADPGESLGVHEIVRVAHAEIVGARRGELDDPVGQRRHELDVVAGEDHRDLALQESVVECC